MLTLTKLVSAEYLIRSVAEGMEDYFMGAGEAPGVWHGRWAAELGLEGVVDAAQLRHLVEGQHPEAGEDLLAGRPARMVNAFDVTLSCPKSVSLLWAFGTDHTASVVTIAQAEATGRALEFLEERAALARQQTGGVRRRVATHGFAVAAFAHRTSRDGDPQLHTHCLIPNLVRRADGTQVAFDASVLHEWAKPAGTVFQNELQRLLTERLGVEWGAERNGTREIVGFTAEQLGAFSKRAAEIEAWLEAAGEEYLTPAERMKANDAASVATRRPKDPSLTPERLWGRWAVEAAQVGLTPGAVERLACRRARPVPALRQDEVFTELVDPDTGLCARDSAFGEADVVTHIAARSAGRLATDEISDLARQFLASEHVVRLVPDMAPGRRKPPEWSTVAHRRLEDHVLAGLCLLIGTTAVPLPAPLVDVALAAHPSLGLDQAEAVRALCGPGPAVRAVLAPAGHGKTTAVRAAMEASDAAGRRVVALATTNKAVAELHQAGVEATTIARFALDIGVGTVAPGTTVVLDEVSQVSTRDAAVVLDAVVNVPGAQLWVLGDPRQAQAVGAAGLAARIERLTHENAVPAAALTVNRRQVDPDDRHALARLRAGDVEASQAIRTGRDWEHEHPTPAQTRHALARAAVAAADTHGAENVAVLAVSHADCEDLADRIRLARRARGELDDPSMAGPGWAAHPRRYAAGDRVLLHDILRLPGGRVPNGSTGAVTHVHRGGLTVRFDDGGTAELSAWFVQGRRADGNPNLSHAWARTIDGAQGGTWAEVHLLGTPALDRHRAYVGQSRGRQPTHTWNVTPTRADDHGGLAPDGRSASQQVLDGMRSEPTKTFAADRDPWALDRPLSAEREQHERFIASRPPDCRLDLTNAKADLERAEQQVARARAYLDWAQNRLAGISPLAGLRRSGRADRARAESDVDGALRGLDHAHAEVPRQQQRIRDLQREVDARNRWVEQHGWHVDRVAAINNQLNRHWANVVLAAARDGDPLAFGIDRLRQAEVTFRADLAALDRSIPFDHSGELRRAEADLRRRQDELRQLEDRPTGLGARLRRSQRPSPGDLDHAHTAVHTAQATLHAQQQAVRDRETAIRDLEPAQREAIHAMRALSTAAALVEPPAVEPPSRPSAPSRDLGIDLGL